MELLAAPRLVNSQSADMQTEEERERGGGRSADIPTVVPTPSPCELPKCRCANLEGERAGRRPQSGHTYSGSYTFFFFRLELLAAPRLANSQSADMQTGKERERGGGRSADIPTVVPTPLPFFFFLGSRTKVPEAQYRAVCWAYELEACAVQLIRMHFRESFLAFPLVPLIRPETSERLVFGVMGNPRETHQLLSCPDTTEWVTMDSWG